MEETEKSSGHYAGADKENLENSEEPTNDKNRTD